MAVNPYQVKNTAEQDKIAEELKRLSGAINTGTGTNIDSTVSAFITQQRLQKDTDLAEVNKRRAESGNAALSYDEYYGYSRPNPGDAPRVASGTLTQQSLSIPSGTQQPQTVTPTSIADLEKQRRINEFERAYQQSIGKLQTEEEKAIKGFEGERSQTRTQGIMNAKAFENFLANQGISASGTAPQGFLQQQGQVQGQLGASRLQQQQYSTDIGRQRAQLGSDLEFNKAQADIDAQLQASKQAYEQQLIQQGWDREDAIRESDRAYDQSQQADELARSDFQNTIMARYNDLQAFADELIGQGAPQWQIDQVLAARQQKIMEQGLDQQGRPIAQPVDNTELQNWAYKKWQAGIPLTAEEQQVLGVQTATQPMSSGGGSGTGTLSTSQALSLWKALGTANDRVASALGIPVGQRYSGTAPDSGSGLDIDISPYSSFIEKNLVTNGIPKKGDIALYLVRLANSIPDAADELSDLAEQYGITPSELEAAENIVNKTGSASTPFPGINAPIGR